MNHQWWIDIVKRTAEEMTMKADLHISIQGSLLHQVRNYCLDNKIRIGQFMEEAIRVKLDNTIYIDGPTMADKQVKAITLKSDDKKSPVRLLICFDDGTEEEALWSGYDGTSVVLCRSGVFIIKGRLLNKLPSINEMGEMIEKQEIQNGRRRNQTPDPRRDPPNP